MLFAKKDDLLWPNVEVLLVSFYHCQVQINPQEIELEYMIVYFLQNICLTKIFCWRKCDRNNVFKNMYTYIAAIDVFTLSIFLDTSIILTFTHEM